MRAPRRRRALVLAAMAAAIALPALLAGEGRRADAGWWDDLDKGESVTLSDLCAEPVRWRDKVVTFACIYHEPAEIYSPYFTSFNAEKYWNVTAWLDGSPLWELEAFQRDDFPFLYLPRNHAQRGELFGFQPYTRIEVTGKVKDVYRNRPWIEIEAVRATAATLGKAVVDYVKSGDGYAAQGNYASAEAHYRRALAEITLADVYRMRIEKRLATVLRSAGKGLEANRLEGDKPVLGATEPPVPGSVGTGLPNARAPGAGAPPGAAPPGELTEDLPGEAMGATLPRRPAAVSVPTPAAPTGTYPPAGPEPALRPVAPPPPGTVRPHSELTDDLPGTPADQGMPPRPPPTTSFPPRSPPALPPVPPPVHSIPPPAPPPVAVPPSVAAAPAPAAPAAPAPVPGPAPAAAAGPAAGPAPVAPPPPPPPARQPRLSGVK